MKRTARGSAGLSNEAAGCHPARPARRLPGGRSCLPVCLPALLLGVLLAGCAGTRPIRGEGGRPLPASIALLEAVELGGVKQWLVIRGQDAGNPILRWLHGGPGAAQMAVARHFNRELEEHFVVVHWDQRGAGKSNPRGFDESTMSFQRFIADVHELTGHLKARCGQERIYLLGHSWGTQLGLRVVHARPEDYYAYIGVSQVTSVGASHEIAHRWLRGRLEEQGRRKDLERLEALGCPPYTDHSTYVRFARMVDAAGGNSDVGMSRLIWAALCAPEYRLRDYGAWLEGAKRGSGPMWNDPGCVSFDAFRDVPRLEIPVYLFNGARDYNTPFELTRQYFERLEAPAGKRLVRFESSAHTPFFAEPESFHRELLRIKAESRPGYEGSAPATGR